MRTTNDERFKCSQLKSWFFLYHLAGKNEIERLQLRFFCVDNNLFKNDSEKALKPSRSGKNSGSLYP